MEITEQNPPTPRPRRRHRLLLRLLAYALGALLVLMALAWALVEHESQESGRLFKKSPYEFPCAKPAFSRSNSAGFTASLSCGCTCA